MKGGLFLDPVEDPLPATNLNSTDHHDTLSAPTDGATNWFENNLVANIINYWYKAHNVYIVYIPYGPVRGLNSEGSTENFTADVCMRSWLGGGANLWGLNWNDTVVASCEDGGMAVLANVGSPYLEPSFYDVKGVTYNTFAYSPGQMITSSVRSFLQYGFK